jgi:alpha-amylase/alpha-mannosidase (GH57 family)
MKRNALSLLTVIILCTILAHAQPSVVPDGVRFVFDDPNATSVSLVGDFNGWSTVTHQMKKTGGGQWSVTANLLPGTYQYAFSIDNNKVVNDPNNSLTFEYVDGTKLNSLISYSPENKLVMEGYPVRKDLNDYYEKKGGTVYLNLIYKHHVPLYYDVKKDQIEAPFVRQHLTRDYFDIADVIQRYPNVHATAVLSPTLLWQLEEIYVKRMEPFIGKDRNNRKPADMNAAGFLARWKGKTDPWIDICLTPAERLTETDKAYLYKNPWNAFTMSPVRMFRFPELVRLFEKWQDAKGNPNYTVSELRLLKFYAILANFDTEFFERRVPLIQTGTQIKRSLDLRDLISYRSDGKYYLKHEISEDDCRRVVASSYFIMASILPNFQKVKYNPAAKIGQVEFASTSYSDAVLPLLINSDIAKDVDPSLTMPSAFAHPEDADAQLKMAISAYQTYLGITPLGYVPPYGAMSSAVVPLLKKNGFEWFASVQNVLDKSQPEGSSIASPYSVTVDGSTINATFSHSMLTHRVNWVYRNYYAENAADDFTQALLALAPRDANRDVLVTVVIDNDDSWMHYQRDIDGKGLINGIYHKLEKLYQTRALLSVTMSEYISGNRERGVTAHPTRDFPALTQLGSGSRFDGNFNVWIGNENCNGAWEAMKSVRDELGKNSKPVTDTTYLDKFNSNPYNFYFASNSPHWTQTFSGSTVLRSNPKQYEASFLNLLNNACTVGGIPAPAAVKPFVPAANVEPDWAKPNKKRTRVTFLCKLADRDAITHVYVAGNRKELSNLEPNTIGMWDNGENGDLVYGDNVWTLVVDIDEGELLYKYSNSGGQGTWEGSEAFPDQWRIIKIEGEKMTIQDIFAKLKK